MVTRLRVSINGVERPVVCDPDKDSLAVVLRRMGLTGTKIGCGIGVCGACSVILNGEVIRSCNRKMKKVPEFSEIITIEGIGTPQHLHPLQQAWITYGGVQCGFCSPGFIVSAYGLLLKNQSPTREEVRAWFKEHKNVCRCTGYKPLVDSVMAAAKVVRGEATMEDITFDTTKYKDFYGTALPRPAALPKVCGLADYGDDIKLKMPEGTAHLAVVISEVHHAKILSIDTSEAETMPGVMKVMTAGDVKGSNSLPVPQIHPRMKAHGILEFPVICGKKINRRGDVVALVAADTEEHARAAAKKVKQNLEILPAYMSYPEAVMPNAIQLQEQLPNFYMEQPLFKGEDASEIIDDADITVEGSFYSSREPHLPIEPDTVQGYYGADGELVIQCRSQALHDNRGEISAATGQPEDKLRIIQNPTGGSFGNTITANTYSLVATAVQNLGIPCTLTLNYEEYNHTTGKRGASYSNARLSCDKDGKISAVEFDVALDHGAYTVVASIIFGNFVSIPFHGYNIPNIKALARAGMSNNGFQTAYRGFGAPQIYTMSEALIDMAAEKLGMDPWEFRYKNLAKPGDTTINSRPYKNYDIYPQLMNKIKPVYDKYKAEAEAAKKEGRHLGVGLSLGGFLCTTGMFDAAEVALELNPDGTITHYNTWQDVGQGGDIGTLTHTLKALEPLGLTPDKVRLVLNDTGTCPKTGLSAASRQHFMAGNATIDAANKLMDAMRKPDGTWRTYDEMVKEGIPTKYLGHTDHMSHKIDPGLNPNNGEGEKNSEFMYAVNCALVEVDVNTGKTQVLRYTTAADVGVIGNKLAVDGQAYGGLSHSIGFALSEDYNAEKKHGNIAGCGVPTIDMIPDDFNIIYQETPRPLGPHGSAGCSENFQCSGHMAVINAISSACGARVYALPATPDKVKAAYDKKQRGEDITPPKYFLGTDFEEELELIRANPM
ncbi:aldehyde oxidoreductase [Sporobacter termitidis DSM 10068]|uniref:Aldehyde oxidoreductase n=1 Tax=Sporobacter termitidis DSM 10068 TaxID=1123282 RepID=A0A1M5ZBY0_9FIRM|nr:molybdopterin cofactor-binding domain-containing protein [Sporobacter termitidis]SHI21403.1 aldehyde oxidoreductase [Sporobacter termitidis DSM 10068]